MFKPKFLIIEKVPFSLAAEMNREISASGMTKDEFLREAIRFSCGRCVHTQAKARSQRKVFS